MGKGKDELKELRKEHAKLVARLSHELGDREVGKDLELYIEEVKAGELPLALREEQPPLVVDLPEGQKLVVGKLEEGYVIEVASWKGTGRPDSRTSRLMLGVTKDYDDEEERNEERVEVRQEKREEEKPRDKVKKKKKVKPEKSRSDPKDNPFKKVGSKVASWFKKHVKGVSATGAIILVLALLYAVGLSVVHPRSGAQISMGSTSNSLIVIKRGSHVAVGDKIVVNVPGKKSPELVVVQAVAPQSVLGVAGNQLIPVAPNQIRGKVLALFPYFGWFANF